MRVAPSSELNHLSCVHDGETELIYWACEQRGKCEEVARKMRGDVDI